MAEKLMRPAEFAEKKLMEAILGGRYGPGDTLPAERVLANELGVTRPTLRETLQRLSKEGWITISHGRSTRVNDFLKTGGLGILHSLVRYGEALSRDMVGHLLEVRTAIFPDIAVKAARKNSGSILSFIEGGVSLPDTAAAYTAFDWQLQVLMVAENRNPVFSMIYNDFEPLFQIMGEQYFQSRLARETSRKYYHDLRLALEKGEPDIRPLVEKTMQQAETVWQEMG